MENVIGMETWHGQNTECWKSDLSSRGDDGRVAHASIRD
jgi:hypothetical protein